VILRGPSREPAAVRDRWPAPVRRRKTGAPFGIGRSSVSSRPADQKQASRYRLGGQ